MSTLSRSAWRSLSALADYRIQAWWRANCSTTGGSGRLTALSATERHTDNARGTAAAPVPGFDGESRRRELAPVRASGRNNVQPKGRMRADNGDAVKQFCIDGQGIAFHSAVTMAESIRLGNRCNRCRNGQGEKPGFIPFTRRGRWPGSAGVSRFPDTEMATGTLPANAKNRSLRKNQRGLVTTFNSPAFALLAHQSIGSLVRDVSISWITRIPVCVRENIFVFTTTII